VSNFFYAVIVPKGITRSQGTKILSGRMMQRNAFEAVKTLERIHPDALKVHVRKEKAQALQSVSA